MEKEEGGRRLTDRFHRNEMQLFGQRKIKNRTAVPAEPSQRQEVLSVFLWLSVQMSIADDSLPSSLRQSCNNDLGFTEESR